MRDFMIGDQVTSTSDPLMIWTRRDEDSWGNTRGLRRVSDETIQSWLDGDLVRPSGGLLEAADEPAPEAPSTKGWVKRKAGDKIPPGTPYVQKIGASDIFGEIREDFTVGALQEVWTPPEPKEIPQQLAREMAEWFLHVMDDRESNRTARDLAAAAKEYL